MFGQFLCLGGLHVLHYLVEVLCSPFRPVPLLDRLVIDVHFLLPQTTHYLPVTARGGLIIVIGHAY